MTLPTGAQSPAAYESANPDALGERVLQSLAQRSPAGALARLRQMPAADQGILRRRDAPSARRRLLALLTPADWQPAMSKSGAADATTPTTNGKRLRYARLSQSGRRLTICARGSLKSLTRIRLPSFISTTLVTRLTLQSSSVSSTKDATCNCPLLSHDRDFGNPPQLQVISGG